MTTATETPELTEVTARRGVGAVDLLWLTWRQHRWTVASGVVLVLAIWGYILWNESAINPQAFAQCRERCFFLQAFGVMADERTAADIHIALAGVFGLIIAVFWAAPLIAREYEQRTNLLAWSQDVSARRWLFGKIVPLAVVATGMAALLGAMVVGEVNRLHGIESDFYPQFTLLRFDASVPLQASVALFGFALGVAVSSVVRRVVPAMAVTALLFVGIRLGLTQLRFHYLPPVRLIGSVSQTPLPPNYTEVPMLVFGQIDSAGNLVSRYDQGRTDIVGTYIDYQPLERLAPFRLIEAGIFLVLTVAAFAVLWIRMRRIGALP
jgi:hypothetical protein